MNDQTVSTSTAAHSGEVTATVTDRPRAEAMAAAASLPACGTAPDHYARVNGATPSQQVAPATHRTLTNDDRRFLQEVLVWPENAQAAGYINLHCHLKNNDPNKNSGKPFVVGWPFKTIGDFLSRAAQLEK